MTTHRLAGDREYFPGTSGRQKAGHSACPRECIEVGPLRLRPGKKDSGGSMVRSMGVGGAESKTPGGAGSRDTTRDTGTRAHGHTGTRITQSTNLTTTLHQRTRQGQWGKPGAHARPRSRPRSRPWNPAASPAGGPRPTQIKRPPPANPRPLLAWLTATIVTGATADGRPAGAGAPGLLPVLYRYSTRFDMI